MSHTLSGPGSTSTGNFDIFSHVIMLWMEQLLVDQDVGV